MCTCTRRRAVIHMHAPLHWHFENYACMRACMCSYMCAHARAQVRMHVHTCLCKGILKVMHACAHACAYTCKCACARARAHICMHARALACAHVLLVYGSSIWAYVSRNSSIYDRLWSLWVRALYIYFGRCLQQIIDLACNLLTHIIAAIVHPGGHSK